MAKGINKVFLLGNIGRDPELRSTSGGTLVANFSLATPDRRKEGSAWVDFTEWHNCIAFGRLAEVLRDYAGKGAKVHVEGKIQTRSWEDKKSGEKKYRTEIIVGELTLLGSPGTKTARPAASTDENEVPGYGYTRETITDDDIPF